LCAVVGLVCLALAANCWLTDRGDEGRRAVIGLLGFIPLATGVWLIHLAFRLVYFGVAPRASLSLPHVLVFFAMVISTPSPATV
jgi:hypothetical protein